MPATSWLCSLSSLSTAMRSCSGKFHKASGSTYLSPDIQNELIAVIGSVVTANIVQRVHKAKFLSTSCDEAADIANLEQLLFVVRY